MILWITNHTTLSVSIVVIVIAIIIGLWAIRDARKKISDIYKLEPTLETMFDIAISRAEEKANLISVNDKELKDTLARIAQDLFNIDAEQYRGKDLRDKKVRERIEKQFYKAVNPSDDPIPSYRRIASVLVNNGYGITDDLVKDTKYIKGKRKIQQIRRVPSVYVKEAVNKCIDYIYILSNNYLFQYLCVKHKFPIGEDILADFQSFIQNQKNHLGEISDCFTEVNIAVDKFVKGNNNG